MASGYLHGIYTREIPTAILPPRTVDTNTIFAVGTAPIETLTDKAKKYINEPRIYYSYKEFVEEMGYSDNWEQYTLCEVAESHFAKFGMAPLVCVNVFDPTIHVTDNSPDPLKVTASDIIGGINQETLQKTGLELIDEVFPRFRLVPFAIIAPKFSEIVGVAAAMVAKTYNINGLFNCVAYVDVSTAICTKYADVPSYKETNNLTDKNLVVCWPRIALDEKIYHMSTQVVGRVSGVDYEAGGYPHASPSNKNLYMNRAITLTAGEIKEVWLDLATANYLNGQGIVTAINFDGGWKLWGNRTACYPSNTDPKDAFLCVRRFFNWYQAQFILTYFSKVDSPLTKRLVKTFMKSEQIKLDGLTSREIILGGRIEFLEDENPLTDLIDGIMRFHVYLTPPVPARVVDTIFEFDPEYFKNLFG